MPNGWEWQISVSEQQHRERIALIREISYETTSLIGEEDLFGDQERLDQLGKALSLNISSGGMLVLMEGSPEIERVLRVQVPTPVPHAMTPTLAEVRWVRKVPFYGHRELHFVGLKFLV